MDFQVRPGISERVTVGARVGKGSGGFGNPPYGWSAWRGEQDRGMDFQVRPGISERVTVGARVGIGWGGFGNPR
jgi:hypothetical protein